MSTTKASPTAAGSASKNATSFSFAEARGLIGDLTRPKPWIYWIDFLISILVGHTALHAVRFLPRYFPDASWLIPAMIAAYVVTVVAYLRALLFTHELVHLPKDGFKGFRIAWNASVASSSWCLPSCITLTSTITVVNTMVRNTTANTFRSVITAAGSLLASSYKRW